METQNVRTKREVEMAGPEVWPICREKPCQRARAKRAAEVVGVLLCARDWAIEVALEPDGTMQTERFERKDAGRVLDAWKREGCTPVPCSALKVW